MSIMQEQPKLVMFTFCSSHPSPKCIISIAAGGIGNYVYFLYFVPDTPKLFAEDTNTNTNYLKSKIIHVKYPSPPTRKSQIKLELQPHITLSAAL